MQDLAETIRATVRKVGSEYAVAQRSGVPQSTVNRFMNGADLHLSRASALCAVLGLELRPTKQSPKLQARGR